MSGGDGFWSVKNKHTDPVLSGYEQAGFNIEIMHIASGKACIFPAWLTSFNENFMSTWNTQNVFGRADPIGSWNNTSRRISIGLSIPSFTPEEGYANMHQLEHLIGFLYPSYSSKGNKVMNAYPLLKMKFANFVKDSRIEENAVSVLKGGLAGWIENVDYTPNLEAGFHHMAPDFNNQQVKAYNKSTDAGTRKTTNKSHTFIPKVIEINMSFVVVHEHSLGWTGTNWLGGPPGTGFPYGYESQGGKLHDVNRGSAQVNNSPMNRIQGGATLATSKPGSKASNKKNTKASTKGQDNKSKIDKLHKGKSK